jgi:hypothetical protein
MPGKPPVAVVTAEVQFSSVIHVYIPMFQGKRLTSGKTYNLVHVTCQYSATAASRHVNGTATAAVCMLPTLQEIFASGLKCSGAILCRADRGSRMQPAAAVIAMNPWIKKAGVQRQASCLKAEQVLQCFHIRNKVSAQALTSIRCSAHGPCDMDHTARCLCSP